MSYRGGLGVMISGQNIDLAPIVAEAWPPMQADLIQSLPQIMQTLQPQIDATLQDAEYRIAGWTSAAIVAVGVIGYLVWTHALK